MGQKRTILKNQDNRFHELTHNSNRNNFIISFTMFEQSTGNLNTFYNTASHPTKLWADSEITRNYPSPQLSFSKEKRFKWSSIYWPENGDNTNAAKKKKDSDIFQAAKKISKMIDDEEKNQARNRLIKRSLSKGKSQLGSPRKQSLSGLSTKKPFKLSKLNQSIVKRLTLYQQKLQSTRRDRHGNRCNLFEDPEQGTARQDIIQAMSKTTGFSTSRKVDLELPHNYFPGPGTYDIKRYLAELDPKSQFYQNLKEKITERSLN